MQAGSFELLRSRQTPRKADNPEKQQNSEEARPQKIGQDRNAAPHLPTISSSPRLSKNINQRWLAAIDDVNRSL